METNQNVGGNGAPPEGAQLPSAEDEFRALVATLKADLAEVQPLVEMARQQLSDIATAKAQAEALLTDVQSKAVDAQTNAAATLAANQQVANALAASQTNSSAISTAVEKIAVHQAKAAGQLTEIIESNSKAAAEVTLIVNSGKKGAAALAEIQAFQAIAAEEVAALQQSRKQGTAHASTLQSLADKSKEVEARIQGYEDRLAQFETQAALQLENITGLLPGATSAGLASAFDARRKSFMKPSTNWQVLFIISIVCLILLAGMGLLQATFATERMGYEEILRLWLTRLPVAAALVWLALHSSREAALAKRLEEDYGYKVAIASTFLGFQKQMADMGASVEASSPLGSWSAWSSSAWWPSDGSVEGSITQP